jgi:hypothetical protein
MMIGARHSFAGSGLCRIKSFIEEKLHLFFENHPHFAYVFFSPNVTDATVAAKHGCWLSQMNTAQSISRTGVARSFA